MITGKCETKNTFRIYFSMFPPHQAFSRCLSHMGVLLDHWLLCTNRSAAHAASFQSHTVSLHSLLLWLITSPALSRLLFFLNIMGDEVKCYGKLSKIKTREQLHSPTLCLTFIARLLTEPCLSCPWRWVLMTDCRPWKEWECYIQWRWRWRCLHNTLSFTFYGLFCSPSPPFFFTLCYFSSPTPPPIFSYLFLWLCAFPTPPLRLCPSTSLSLPVLLSFAEIFKSFPSLLPPQFSPYLYRHLLPNVYLSPPLCQPLCMAPV